MMQDDRLIVCTCYYMLKTNMFALVHVTFSSPFHAGWFGTVHFHALKKLRRNITSAAAAAAEMMADISQAEVRKMEIDELLSG